MSQIYIFIDSMNYDNANNDKIYNGKWLKMFEEITLGNIIV